ncbi:MAG: acetylneuraminic acid synthetase [Firmicutes bacterium]|nr:acetylneuraminic acid synthetase [Bacillota bacterium]
MEKIIESRIKDNKFVLIAEIGVNYYDIAVKEHISPIQAAKLMIKESACSGVHAVKFQSYKAETLAAKESPYYWDIKEEPTDSQYKLFKKFDSFGQKEYEELADYAEKIGVEFLSTAFDLESADYLEPLMNVYKISSSDLNNLSFVEYQAKKGKPIILSVGASNEDEIIRTVELIRKYNDKLLVLMHCVLEYPTPYKHANLNKIISLSKKFPDLAIGYSDHTKPDEGFEILKTAYNLGATVIEKHFTLDKTLKGNDHYHAMDPCDVKSIIEAIDFANYIRGDGRLYCLESERKARENARRSLVAAMDIPNGTVINEDMLTFKRPGTGIPADNYSSVIGKKTLVDIIKDTIIKPSMLVTENVCMEMESDNKSKDTVKK